MFGNVRLAFATISENRRKSSESGRKSSENGRRHMPACGYEFYLLVFNSISHSFAARSCNILYILLDVLVCSITGYFYELCRILTSP